MKRVDIAIPEVSNIRHSSVHDQAETADEEIAIFDGCLIPNEKADKDDVRFAIELKLNSLKSMAYVAQNDSFGTWNEEIRESYLAQIADLTNEVQVLIQLYNKIGAKHPKRSIELMRSLFERIYTVDYYFHPDAERKETRASAEKALDGIYDLMSDVVDELGLKGVPICAPQYAEKPTNSRSKNDGDVH